VGEESGGSKVMATLMVKTCKDDDGPPIDLDGSKADEGVGALMWGLIGFFLGCVVMVIILSAALK